MSIRKRVGVMVPSTNTTCEGDFQMASPDDMTIHSHRLWMTDQDNGPQGIAEMNEEIEGAASYLSTASVDVIAYGCTTGSFYKGPGWDEEMVRIITRTAGVPGIATSPSVLAALEYFQAKKISVVTPYPDWDNKLLSNYLSANNLEVLNLESEPWAAKAGNQGINDQDPSVILEFASKACHPKADAIFCSCTAWRSMEAAEALERLTGKPVVTSNQATIWATFRRIGITTPVKGFGKLLEGLSPNLV